MIMITVFSAPSKRSNKAIFPESFFISEVPHKLVKIPHILRLRYDVVQGFSSLTDRNKQSPFYIDQLEIK